MATHIWISVGFGNDLLPGGTESLSELMLSSSHEVLMNVICNMCWGIVKLLPHLLGPRELIANLCLSRSANLLILLCLGRSECESKNWIFNLVLLIGIFRSSHDNALGWMLQYHTDDKSTLVQVMAWCYQATSHYLSQCWLSPFSLDGVARPQWVKSPLSDSPH